MAALQNAKHENVALAYIADPERVGWRAYAKIYPKSTEAAAKTAFSRLLKNADFQARISELGGAVREALVESVSIDIKTVVEELAKIGFANILDYARVSGEGEPFVDMSKMTRQQAAAVQSFTVEDFKDGRGEDARDVRKVTFKLHDKRAALVDILKHLGGAGTSRHEHEHSGPAGGPIPIEQKPMSNLELARRIAFALEQGARIKPTVNPAVNPAVPAGRASKKKKGGRK